MTTNAPLTLITATPTPFAATTQEASPALVTLGSPTITMTAPYVPTSTNAPMVRTIA